MQHPESWPVAPRDAADRHRQLEEQPPRSPAFPRTLGPATVPLLPLAGPGPWRHVPAATSSSTPTIPCRLRATPDQGLDAAFLLLLRAARLRTLLAFAQRRSRGWAPTMPPGRVRVLHHARILCQATRLRPSSGCVPSAKLRTEHTLARPASSPATGCRLVSLTRALFLPLRTRVRSLASLTLHHAVYISQGLPCTAPPLMPTNEIFPKSIHH
jgi:hypothetical protein